MIGYTKTTSQNSHLHTKKNMHFMLVTLAG